MDRDEIRQRHFRDLGFYPDDDALDAALSVAKQAQTTGTPMVERSGVWVAFYADRSGAATFPTEIEALQYAVAMNADVQFVKWGEDVFTKDTRV